MRATDTKKQLCHESCKIQTSKPFPSCSEPSHQQCLSQVHRQNWIPHDRHAWLGYRWGKGSTNSGHPLGLRSGVSMCGWEVWMRPKAECLFHLSDIPTGRSCHLSSSRWQLTGHFGTCGFRFVHFFIELTLTNSSRTATGLWRSHWWNHLFLHATVY